MTKKIQANKRSKNSLTPFKPQGSARSEIINEIFPTNILRKYKENKTEKIQYDLSKNFLRKSIFTL